MVSLIRFLGNKVGEQSAVETESVGVAASD